MGTPLETWQAHRDLLREVVRDHMPQLCKEIKAFHNGEVVGPMLKYVVEIARPLQVGYVSPVQAIQYVYDELVEQELDRDRVRNTP